MIKLKRRIGSAFLACMMMLSLLPVTAMAAGTGVTCSDGDSCTTHEAAYNGKHYTTIEQAIEAANSNKGGTIKLLKNATMEKTSF